jgi:Transposase DDE domain
MAPSHRRGNDCSGSLIDWANSTGKWPRPMRRSPRPQRGFSVSKTRKVKGTKLLVLIDGQGLPLGVSVDSAQRSDVRQIEPLLEERILDKQNSRLIYDRAADSDALRDCLQPAGIELICQHHKNRKRPPKQDGRKLLRRASAGTSSKQSADSATVADCSCVTHTSVTSTTASLNSPASDCYSNTYEMSSGQNPAKPWRSISTVKRNQSRLIRCFQHPTASLTRLYTFRRGIWGKYDGLPGSERYD